MKHRNRLLTYVLGAIGLSTLVLYVYHSPLKCSSGPGNRMVPHSRETVVQGSSRTFKYSRTMPLIFIGGMPRSGTTLVRAMLDAHPAVRCGEETRVIPRILGMRSHWAKSQRESRRLQEAGLTDDVIDSALAAFILEVIARHGEPAERLCNKDPFTLKSSVYLGKMFPAAKFVLMVRDGRAVVHSIISRKITISGFNIKSFSQCLQKWNQAMETMYRQCVRLGPARCMPLYYEQLVLKPEHWMRRLLTFLNVTWSDAVLQHDRFIGVPGGVSLSKTERSTDQVIKPVNLEALTKWVYAVPDDVRQSIDSLAPMLQRLGYDSHAFPPHYGVPERRVVNNTRHIKEHEAEWRARSADVMQLKKAPWKPPERPPPSAAQAQTDVRSRGERLMSSRENTEKIVP